MVIIITDDSTGLSLKVSCLCAERFLMGVDSNLMSAAAQGDPNQPAALKDSSSKSSLFLFWFLIGAHPNLQPLNDETKILTETETFLPGPNFWKPIQILFSNTKFSETETFFRDKIFRNQNRDFFSETKFSETETLKDLAKVLKSRSFETEMSISDVDRLEQKKV